jgi:hypothetical protein
MAADFIPADLSTPLLCSAVVSAARDGARDAHAVIGFLNHLAHAWRDNEVGQWLSKKPVRLPAQFLLGLGAALRLVAWEIAGIQIHRTAGLPTAHEALLDVFRSVSDAEAAMRTHLLPTQVFALTRDNFAWAGQAELNADVMLDAADEELALEVLADFLWENRHLGRRERRT